MISTMFSFSQALTMKMVEELKNRFFLSFIFLTVISQ